MSLNIKGQKKAIDIAVKFLDSWSPKKTKKALFIWGPAGTGKTLLVREIAKMKNLDLIEINASDKRNASKIREFLGRTIKQHSLTGKGKIILIDEMDGLSGRDSGAVAEISKTIKETMFPVVLISSNPYDKKFLPLRNLSVLVEMKKLSTADVEKYLIEYCKMKGMEFNPEKIRLASVHSKGDMRRAVISFETGTFDPKDGTENIFKTLQIIFREKDPEKVIKTIKNSEKSPDDIFHWVAENICVEFSTPEQLSVAYEILSKTDIIRRKHKSWINHLLGFSHIQRRTSFRYYKPPSPYIRPKKLEIPSHCSNKKLMRELPYMKFLKIR